MVHPVKFVARGMLGAVFITGGLNQLKDQTYGAAMTDAAKEQYGLGDLPDSELLVKLNGAGMLAAGVGLALGIKPRRAALLAAALLQPTNIAGHAFWTIDDPQRAAAQRNQFMANVAITGGLLYAATDF